jgi:DNA-binding GntR family transcriptional regulator
MVASGRAPNRAVSKATPERKARTETRAKAQSTELARTKAKAHASAPLARASGPRPAPVREAEAFAAHAAFSPATHRTLHEHAYQQIREALMVGRFVPGQPMTIRGLAEALGISPTPIREVLHRLVTEGALRVLSNRRLIVPQLSAQEFRELRQIRRALEGLATERAVERITPEQVAALRQMDSNIRELRRAGDVPGTIREIHRLHHTLYAAAGMPALKQLIEGLWLRNGPYLHLLFPEFAGREQGRLRAQTLAAIERGDAIAARESMQADLDTTAEYLIDLLSRDEGRGEG